MTEIRFGPAGLGGVGEAERNLEEFHKLGFKACEISFTYGPYIKEQDAERIGVIAKKLGIKLSIHAHYWINLNSEDAKKIEQSKKRILDCCRIGEKLGAEVVVFHPGYYGKSGKEETYETIKKGVLEVLEEIKKNKWQIKIAPETTGKVNVFGSLDETLKLSEETGCSFCIDFAHILAREKDYNFKKAIDNFGKYKSWHIHFSGIAYGEKGERNHEITPESEIKKLLKNLPKGKDVTIINESPDPVGDSIKSIKLSKN